MSDKLQGGVKVGSTSVSLPILLRSTADNTEVTGKVHTDVTGSYWRQGGTRTAITMASLAAVDSAYSAGGFKEVDATNQKGLYRLDVPDAAFAVGADWVIVTVQVAGCYAVHQRFDLTTNVIQSGNSYVGVDTLVSKLPAGGALIGDATSAGIWSYGSRTLSSFGNLVQQIVSSIIGNLSAGVFQALITVTEGTPIKATRGDFLPAGTITATLGSAWWDADSDYYFCVKRDRKGAKLIDLKCTVTDEATTGLSVPDIDLEDLGLETGKYWYEFERVRKSDGKRPRTTRRGEFIIEQDVRQ